MADVNIEEIVIGFLDANKSTGWYVYGDMPKTRPAGFVLVDRTGGPREYIVQDRAEIVVEVYHKTSRESASDEANRIADILKNLESLEPVMRAKVTSLVKLDDLLGQYWRYQIYCDVFYRRDVSTDGIIYPVIPNGGVTSVNSKIGAVVIAAGNDINIDNSGATIVISSTKVSDVQSVNGQTGVVVLDADDIDDSSTTNKFTTASDISKLAGIEAGADVTDATNVDAAGATMNTDTDVSGNDYVLDEDDMASNSATKVPTQQSTKAYADTKGFTNYTGGIPSRPTGFETWFTALENAHTTPVDIVIFGDSTSVQGNLTTARPWTWLLSDYLSRYFYGATNSTPPTGWVPSKSSAAPGTEPYADNTTGTYTGTGFSGHGVRLNNGEILEHTTTCDRVSVVYRTSASGGNVEVRDGGSGGTLLATINMTGADTWGNVWTSDALSEGSHHIYLVATSGTASYIEGFYFYLRNYDQGVRVWVGGKSGATSQTPVTASWEGLVNTLQPDMIVYATGFNDYANYDTYMRALIDTYTPIAPNANKALWIPYILPSSDRWIKSPNVDWARAIASDYDMGIIDASVGIPDMSSSLADLKYDSTHPNAKGNQRIATHATSVISGDPMGNLLHVTDEAIESPSSSTADNVVTFADDTGRVGKDSGVAINDLATDSAVVHIAGTETVTGAKSFSSQIAAPAGVVVDTGGAGGAFLSGTLFGYAILALYNASGDAQVALAFTVSGLMSVLGYPSAGMLLGAGGSSGIDTAMYRSAAGEITVAGDFYANNTPPPRLALAPTGAISQTHERNSFAVGNLALLVSGTLRLAAIPLKKGQTVTSISFVSRTTAGSAMTNQWFGLFDSSRVCLAVTNDDTSTAWGANTVKTLNLTTPYAITTSGLYYIGLMVKGTTPPTLAGIANAATVIPALTPVLGGDSTTGLTTPISTGGTATALSNVGTGYPYAYVS